jgi:hypothetical protein
MPSLQLKLSSHTLLSPLGLIRGKDFCGTGKQSAERVEKARFEVVERPTIRRSLAAVLKKIK